MRFLNSLSFFLVLTFPLSLEGEEVGMGNRFLSISVKEESEQMISQITDCLQDVSQLRAERSSVLSALGGASGVERGGVRAGWEEGQKPEIALWKVERQEENLIRLKSENAQATVTLTMLQERRSFSVEMEWGMESPLNQSNILWEWMLEVGGDFFAIPTEGIADYQILPVENDQRDIEIQVSEVPRVSDVSLKLAHPWWAVVDQNRSSILVCQIQSFDNEVPGTLKIHQVSGVQGSSPAFSQTLVFPAKEHAMSKKILAYVTLYTGLRTLHALGRETAYQVFEKEGDSEIHAATSREIEKGKLVLYDRNKVRAEWPIEGWSPAHTLVLPLGKESPFLEGGEDCRMELFDRDVKIDTISFYRKKKP